MLLLCVWLKLFRCCFVPLLEPNPSLVSPDPINARLLRSLGFPKSSPPKNPRSTNVTPTEVGKPMTTFTLFQDIKSMHTEHYRNTGHKADSYSPLLHNWCLVNYRNFITLHTRSSAIAEGLHDALSQLKSCQQCRNYLYNKAWTNWSYEVGWLRWADV